MIYPPLWLNRHGGGFFILSRIFTLRHESAAHAFCVFDTLSM